MILSGLEEIEYIKFPIDDFGIPSNNKFDELKELISTIKKNQYFQILYLFIAMVEKDDLG